MSEIKLREIAVQMAFITVLIDARHPRMKIEKNPPIVFVVTSPRVYLF